MTPADELASNGARFGTQAGRSGVIGLGQADRARAENGLGSRRIWEKRLKEATVGVNDWKPAELPVRSPARQPSRRFNQDVRSA